jgi:MinD superfamily P-loop ATPase
MSEIPVIHQDKCNGCGLCISVCLCNSLVLSENVISFVRKGDCGWCTWCEAVCPTGAISCPFEIVVEERQAT